MGGCDICLLVSLPVRRIMNALTARRFVEHLDIIRYTCPDTFASEEAEPPLPVGKQG